MNDDFLNDAFTKEEQAIINTTDVSADENPNYKTSQGNDTQDKVFLLSIIEADLYFGNDNERMCVPTTYARKKGAYTSETQYNDGSTCWWWLRTSGNSRYSAANIYTYGRIYSSGGIVSSVHDGVRPAMWIS